MPGSLGFGAYRVGDTDIVHAQALASALEVGVRIIDTSTNYGNGASERMIGAVLKTIGPPDDLVIVTKVGYAQGEGFELIKTQEATGTGYEDVVDVGEGLRHCIHPRFIADMLASSMERLNRTKIDVLLLHNPEYFLQVSHQHGTDVIAAREALYERIELAFSYLEDARKNGLIGSYGVSSNTFGHAIDAPDHISVERCMLAAEHAGGSEHGFTHVQMPLNLIEHHAITNENQRGGTASTIEVAREAGLHVMANRPLNAIVGQDLIRLASHETPLHPITPDALEARIHDLEVEEHEVQQIVMGIEGLSDRDHSVIQESFRIAGALCGAWNTFEGIIHWRDVRRAYLNPRLELVRQYSEKSAGTARCFEYADNIERILDDLDTLYAVEENQSLEELREAVADEFGLPLDTPLHHVAIHAVQCTEGVNTVLVGMRTPEYVVSAMDALALPETTYHRSSWNRVAAHLARLSA